MHYFVYVLQSSADGRLYIGVTQDVASQLASHNTGQVELTKHRRPFQLVRSKPFPCFREAHEAELLLKRLKDPRRIRRWMLT